MFSFFSVRGYLSPSLLKVIEKAKATTFIDFTGLIHDQKEENSRGACYYPASGKKLRVLSFFHQFFPHLSPFFSHQFFTSNFALSLLFPFLLLTNSLTVPRKLRASLTLWHQWGSWEKRRKSHGSYEPIEKFRLSPPFFHNNGRKVLRRNNRFDYVDHFSLCKCN